MIGLRIGTGWPWRRREYDIHAEAVQRLQTDGVVLGLARDEVRHAEGKPVRRATKRMGSRLGPPAATAGAS